MILHTGEEQLTDLADFLLQFTVILPFCVFLASEDHMNPKTVNHQELSFRTLASLEPSFEANIVFFVI